MLDSDSDSDSNFNMNAVIDRLENQLSSKTRKVCIKGKELNLVTGRCRNVCKPGTVRNKKGRCVKIKGGGVDCAFTANVNIYFIKLN